MKEENKNMTPPPFDPGRKPEPTPWYKRKETIIGIVIAVIVLGAIISAITFGARLITNHTIASIVSEKHEYRMLNEAGEYIASGTLDVYDGPEGTKTGGSFKENDIVWCDNTAYIDETEGLWGQTKTGWILIRDEDGSYASENVLTETNDGPGTIEAAKEIILYSDPSESAEQTGTLAKDEQARYTAVFRDLIGHEWYELENGSWAAQSSSVKEIQSKEAKDEPQTDEKKSDTETKETDEETIPTEFAAKYAMKIRKEPNLDAEQVGSIKENEKVMITELKDGDNESVWGKIEDGKWVCMQDKEYTYFEETETEDTKETEQS
ncbi:MAG TPA: hypothetical protein DCP49_04675 [Erysipelotrichaceae bacterium]|nr:hypothetical protein [Erysipelotrichaceae bacterium]